MKNMKNFKKKKRVEYCRFLIRHTFTGRNMPIYKSAVFLITTRYDMTNYESAVF